MKVIVSLSGGMDSATLLGYYVNEYGKDNVMAVSFHYPSKHNKYETQNALNLTNFFDVKHLFLNIENIFQYSKSNLLQSGGDIPEGHYNEPTMKQTVVPGRNLIFSSILASIAESQGFDAIALAVHAGDHHIYPDCRKAFMDSLSTTVKLSTDHKVDVLYPFIYSNKANILRVGEVCNVPYQYTRTCYKDQELSCGKCGSCTERLEAFQQIGKEDPIKYEE